MERMMELSEEQCRAICEALDINPDSRPWRRHPAAGWVHRGPAWWLVQRASLPSPTSTKTD